MAAINGKGFTYKRLGIELVVQMTVNIEGQKIMVELYVFLWSVSIRGRAFNFSVAYKDSDLYHCSIYISTSTEVYSVIESPSVYLNTPTDTWNFEIFSSSLASLHATATAIIFFPILCSNFISVQFRYILLLIVMHYKYYVTVLFCRLEP